MMPEHLVSSDHNDTRFQYEVIRGLADSIRQMAAQMADIQKTQVAMLERLATLEANRFGEAVAKLEVRLEAAEERIDALVKDKDRRDGALGVLGALRVWGGPIFGLVIAMYLVGRSMGLIPSPPTTVTKIETPIAVERREEKPEVER